VEGGSAHVFHNTPGQERDQVGNLFWLGDLVERPVLYFRRSAAVATQKKL
jgi:hypothetical protein